MMKPTITQLYRYPVKGMSPESLQKVDLQVGEIIPLDRHFALAHGTTEFNLNVPKHLSKTHFLMLMKNEKLAALRTVYDEKTGVLSIFQSGQLVVSAKLCHTTDRQTIEQFFIQYLDGAIRGQPKLVYAPGHSFSDVNAKVLSFINLASVRDFEEKLGQSVDPLRFRANVYYESHSAWSELDWVGREFTVGTAGFKVLKRTQRCAATEVNPQTAERDIPVPKMLLKHYGHSDMGFYAHVVQAGNIAISDELII